jgi:hypothetical protein
MINLEKDAGSPDSGHILAAIELSWVCIRLELSRVTGRTGVRRVDADYR